MRRHAVVTRNINTNTALPSQTETENDQNICHGKLFTQLCCQSIMGKKKAINEEIQLRTIFQLLWHQLLMTPEAEHI